MVRELLNGHRKGTAFARPHAQKRAMEKLQHSTVVFRGKWPEGSLLSRAVLLADAITLYGAVDFEITEPEKPEKDGEEKLHPDQNWSSTLDYCY